MRGPRRIPVGDSLASVGSDVKTNHTRQYVAKTMAQTRLHYTACMSARGIYHPRRRSNFTATPFVGSLVEVIGRMEILPPLQHAACQAATKVSSFPLRQYGSVRGELAGRGGTERK